MPKFLKAEDNVYFVSEDVSEMLFEDADLVSPEALELMNALIPLTDTPFEDFKYILALSDGDEVDHQEMHEIFVKKKDLDIILDGGFNYLSYGYLDLESQQIECLLISADGGFNEYLFNRDGIQEVVSLHNGP